MRISRLKIDGAMCGDLPTIQDHIVHFYEELFTDNLTGLQMPDLEEFIPKKVPAGLISDLVRVPGVEDSQKAVIAMDPHSAPGPDGFSGLFFQKAWAIIGDDVSAAIIRFFVTFRRV